MSWLFITSECVLDPLIINEMMFDGKLNMIKLNLVLVCSLFYK